MSDLSPVWISLKTASTATIITFIIGTAAARCLYDYRGRGKNIIEALLTAPLVLPPTVIGFLLLLLFGKRGSLGQILQWFDITIIFTWYATVIAATVVAFPLMYKTAAAAFRQIDPNLIACARTLGASEWTVFWRIMLPLAKPGLLGGALLAFARALGEFGATLMLAGSIPGKTQTIPIAIFLAAESGADDRALFLVLIVLAISLAVIVTVNHWLDQPAKYSRLHQRQRLPVASKTLEHNRSTPIALVVDIQKQLAQFKLDIAFTTDQTPLGLLGASGAGKSLILRCIAGLETPDKGKIILNGRVLFDSATGVNLPPRDRACGFLFQNYALFPHLTVAENIAFGMPKDSSIKLKQKIEQYLIDVDLPGMANRYRDQLSGGQQQRVALARAKASNPEILLLDEPFSALDTFLRHKLEKLLRRNLAHFQGVTLFITHNLEEAYRVCPRLLAIDQGCAIANSSKQDLFEHPPNYRTAQISGCKNFSRAVAVSSHQIRATDWNCILEVVEPIDSALAYVGIRAHQLQFFPEQDQHNTFLCWLAACSETQHRITLYLKLHQPPHNEEDYHLQAEVFKERWAEFKDNAFPWQIQLSAIKLILLGGDRYR